jgi:hypothetical protein
MAVVHILKDGSRVSSIQGHVVKIADAEPLYRLLHSMNQKPNRNKSQNTYNRKIRA